MFSPHARRLVALAVLVVALEAVCRAHLVRPTDLVPPTIMLRSMAAALTEPVTLYNVWQTLSSVAASVVIAAVAGVAAGIVLHALPRLRQACEPFIASYYALPLFALYPLLVVILGVGTAPIVFTGTLYAAMSVLIGTLSGLDHVPPVLRKVAKVHRLGAFRRLASIYIPSCSREILGGITLGVSYAFVAVIASEFLLAPAGIGHDIADSVHVVQDRAHVWPDAGPPHPGVPRQCDVAAFAGSHRGAGDMIWKNARRRLDVALICLALALAWQIASWKLGTDVLPGPWHTLRQLAALIGQPRFRSDIAATASAYAIALAIAMAGGLTLGLICGGWKAVGDEIEPPILAVIATPKVMLYPIILLFFGLGDAAKIFFGLLHGLPPVVIIMANALRTLRPIYRKVSQTMRLSRRAYARHVLIPAVMPEAVASFRICFALTLLGVLIGEMFASTRGLGHLLFASIGTNDQLTIMAVTLLLFVFAGLGSSLLLGVRQSFKNSTA